MKKLFLLLALAGVMVACGGEKKDKATEKSLVEQAFEALKAEDFEALEALEAEYNKLSAEEQAAFDAELMNLINNEMAMSEECCDDECCADKYDVVECCGDECCAVECDTVECCDDECCAVECDTVECCDDECCAVECDTVECCGEASLADQIYELYKAGDEEAFGLFLNNAYNTYSYEVVEAAMMEVGARLELENGPDVG